MKSDLRLQPGSHRKLGGWIKWSAWVYFALTLATCSLLWFSGDRWWFGTVLCFGPRWILLIPFPFLVLLGRKHWKACLAPLSLTAVVFPFWLGFSLPFGAMRDLTPETIPFRVISFNTDVGGPKDIPVFAEWAAAQRPDLI